MIDAIKAWIQLAFWRTRKTGNQLSSYIKFLQKKAKQARAQNRLANCSGLFANKLPYGTYRAEDSKRSLKITILIYSTTAHRAVSPRQLGSLFVFWYNFTTFARLKNLTSVSIRLFASNSSQNRIVNNDALQLLVASDKVQNGSERRLLRQGPRDVYRRT